MAYDFINYLATAVDWICNSIISQLGISAFLIILLCLILKCFAVDKSYIKRIASNSVFGILLLYILKLIGIVQTVTLWDIALCSIFGVFGILFVIKQNL